MIAALMIGIAAAAGAVAPTSAVRTSLVLAVEQREASADRLVESTEALGGYFAARSLSSVSLRVPVDAADALLQTAEAEGLVVARDYSRVDLSAALAEQQATLDTRQEMLDQYFEVLPGASADAVVTVEREITRLVEEIERLEGSLKLARHQAEFAQVDVAFEFRDRAAPVSDGASSFDWLNTLNLADLVQDFELGRPAPGPRFWGSAEVPEGFSAYPRDSERRAVSPDGVLYRVRAARHKPRAELAFWEEAARLRMEAAGYRLVSEEDLSASGVEGALIELAAPFGQTDYSYLIAIFPAGRRLVLIEAAGEISQLEARRDAIRAAVLTLNP